MSDQPTKLIITKLSTPISVILVEESLNLLFTEYTPKLGECLSKLSNVNDSTVGLIKIFEGLSDGFSLIILGDSLLSNFFK